MKKLLSLLAVFGLSTTTAATAATVVSCSRPGTDTMTPTQKDLKLNVNEKREFEFNNIRTDIKKVNVIISDEKKAEVIWTKNFNDKLVIKGLSKGAAQIKIQIDYKSNVNVDYVILDLTVEEVEQDISTIIKKTDLGELKKADENSIIAGIKALQENFKSKDVGLEITGIKEVTEKEENYDLKSSTQTKWTAVVTAGGYTGQLDITFVIIEKDQDEFPKPPNLPEKPEQDELKNYITNTQLGDFDEEELTFTIILKRVIEKNPLAWYIRNELSSTAILEKQTTLKYKNNTSTPQETTVTYNAKNYVPTLSDIVVITDLGTIEFTKEQWENVRVQTIANVVKQLNNISRDLQFIGVIPDSITKDTTYLNFTAQYAGSAGKNPEPIAGNVLVTFVIKLNF